MSRWIIIGLVLFSLAACSPSQAEPTITSSPEVPTVTPTPALTETPLPSLTSTPTPTPTPEPYLLEDDVLLDWDEVEGGYVKITEGIETIVTIAEGVIVAVGGDGFPRFVFENGDWIEKKIPEGVENYVEKVLERRYVSIVNEKGIVEEVLESGTKVLVNPETGIYEYEFKNGQWEEYVPRVMVVGEDRGEERDLIEVPREVVETASETVKNAEMIKRMENGELVELKTGLDERWSDSQHNGRDYIHWYGVLCGVEYSGVHGFMGVEMNSGDILLINMRFYKTNDDASDVAIVFTDGLIPDIDYEGGLDDMGDLGKMVSLRQIANAILKSPIGTPLYFTSQISGDEFEAERMKVWDAMKTGEFLGSSGSSFWTWGNMGGSNTFWNLVEEQ